MKIIVLDGYVENPGDLSWEPLAALGELTVYQDVITDEAELIRRIGDAEVVVVNKTGITRSMIDACPNLGMIAILATGYDVIDYRYAAEKGIPVMNVPGYGTQIVGQYAVGLLLEITSHIGHHAAGVAEGRWENSPQWCYWDYPLIELYGKTAGIIGLGRIGRATAKILSAMNMRVLAYDQAPCEEGRELAEYVTLDQLYAESDVIFLHCPLFPENKEMINRESIAKMKTGVILINNSRGGLVCEQDLADALNSGKVYAAGLDVVSHEPITPDNPLKIAKNCLITPHISWASQAARQRIMDQTAENIRAFVSGSPINVVNR